jgi:hypothetical protein
MTLEPLADVTGAAGVTPPYSYAIGPGALQPSIPLREGFVASISFVRFDLNVGVLQPGASSITPDEIDVVAGLLLDTGPYSGLLLTPDPLTLSNLRTAPGLGAALGGTYTGVVILPTPFDIDAHDAFKLSGQVTASTPSGDGEYTALFAGNVNDAGGISQVRLYGTVDTANY